MHNENFEIYVTGSNSKFLSKDIITEFRGRSCEIRVWSLSFADFFAAKQGETRQIWQEYYTYCGLPRLTTLPTHEQKVDYLRDVYEITYLKDVVERNHLRNDDTMRQISQIMASDIGCSVNPTRISNTFKSLKNKTISSQKVSKNINYLVDSFLIEPALRYNIKSRKHIGSETKFYFVDLGLRAIALNFRQQEETHIMENIIYNELRSRGYLVDVGLVEVCIFNLLLPQNQHIPPHLV